MLTKPNAYNEYLIRKIQAQRNHISWLNTELQYAKNDKYSGWAVAAALAVIVSVMWMSVAISGGA